MTITALRIANFRNLAAVELAPSAGLNIICGENGSGKTSLLEAIHYLSLGRSFRSALATRLIRYQTQKFSVFAQIKSDIEQQLAVGVERDINGAARSRIAEREATGLSELTYLIPIHIVNSQSHQLFESGPLYRRKYLDWGLFYHSESFLIAWRHYERALKQRNVILRDKKTKRELDVWTEELVKYGLILDGLRRDYVEAITPFIAAFSQTLLGLTGLSIQYQCGWDESLEYAAHFMDYVDEFRLGYTQYGPHRADLNITMEGVAVKHFLSRGQQKLLICAMLVAQGLLLNKQVNKRIIYLVDDLAAELDLHSRQKLISLLSQQKTQVFITAIEQATIWPFITEQAEIIAQVFHVKHGEVSKAENLNLGVLN